MRRPRRPAKLHNPGYRPAHAWLGHPGDGVRLKHRDPGKRWRFRWLQLRIVAIAAALSGLAWWQLLAG
ncbi:hypothetical protein P1X14_20385 [Sphingomonas sp. AOB5]|uniref:hypothetical protein n=1 Tax=Sphingomonas sp. AOB5 TaxID=3034017 RepID=UPI0023F997ED|nr:hypothetical protein [Sphingomonas sp. AOB5]MDF7777625.1 hypothetical protein [Sphingomonas sp. AOB5]